MNKEKIGTIDGHAIYVDSGPNYQQMLLEAVRSRVDRKKLKVGQTFMMVVDFDGKQFLIESEVKEWNDR